jgi:hypothetical protein
MNDEFEAFCESVLIPKELSISSFLGLLSRIDPCLNKPVYKSSLVPICEDQLISRTVVETPFPCARGLYFVV